MTGKKIPARNLISIILIGLMVVLLTECKEITIEEQNIYSDSLSDNPNLSGLSNRIIKQLGEDLVTADLSVHQATIIQQGALQEVDTQDLSDSDNIVLIAPAVMKGAQQAIGSSQADTLILDEKLRVIEIILKCVTKLLPHEVTQNALIKLGTNRNTANSSSLLRNTKETVYQQIYSSLAEVVIQNLDEAGIGVADAVSATQTLICSLISTLSTAGVEESMVTEVIKLIIKNAVSSLDEGGVEPADLGDGIRSIIIGTLQGLQSCGMNQEDLMALDGILTTGSIEGMFNGGVLAEEGDYYAELITLVVLEAFETQGVSEETLSLMEDYLIGVAAMALETAFLTLKEGSSIWGQMMWGIGKWG